MDNEEEEEEAVPDCCICCSCCWDEDDASSPSDCNSIINSCSSCRLLSTTMELSLLFFTVVDEQVSLVPAEEDILSSWHCCVCVLVRRGPGIQSSTFIGTFFLTCGFFKDSCFSCNGFFSRSCKSCCCSCKSAATMFQSPIKKQRKTCRLRCLLR